MRGDDARQDELDSGVDAAAVVDLAVRSAHADDAVGWGRADECCRQAIAICRPENRLRLVRVVEQVDNEALPVSGPNWHRRLVRTVRAGVNLARPVLGVPPGLRASGGQRGRGFSGNALARDYSYHSDH